MAEFVLYGNVSLIREWCEDCKQHALVIDGQLACCDKFLGDSLEPKRIKRVSEPPDNRASLPKWEKEKQLNAQDNCCFYCNRRFYSIVYRSTGKKVKLTIHWDHIVPFVFTQDNCVSNYVAACNICNSFKNDKVFTSLDEIKIYLYTKWNISKISDKRSGKRLTCYKPEF